MKAFRFSLQAILTLREEQEQEAQRAYARTLRAVETAQAALENAIQDWNQLALELQARLARGTSAQELAQLQSYRTVLEERQKRLRAELARAQKNADLAQAALRKAAQNHQVLEHYRDRLRRTYDQNVVRAERAQLDDLAGRSPTLAAAWRTAPTPNPSSP